MTGRPCAVASIPNRINASSSAIVAFRLVTLIGGSNRANHDARHAFRPQSRQALEYLPHERRRQRAVDELTRPLS
jgi:hypothetical protein